MTHRVSPLIVLCAGVAGCSEKSADVPPPPSRPVRVVELGVSAPPPGALFPGLVTPYRESVLAFEIPGRVTRLVNVGDDMFGDRIDRDRVVVEEGTIVAQLDPAPFERALKQTERRLASARSELDALQLELDRVLPARLDSARSSAEAAKLNVQFAVDDVKSLESTVDLARTTLERNRGLLPTGAVSDITVRESSTSLNVAEARLSQGRTQVAARQQEQDAANAAVVEAEAALALQRARIASQEAVIEELEQLVLDATSDLEDCSLRAPFDGRITTVSVAEGSYVGAGSPVATLTMLNPIEVQLTVAPAIEDELVVGSGAVIYPLSGGVVATDRAIEASVFEKSGVANRDTRTFTVGVIATNKRRAVQADHAQYPTTPYLLPVFDNPLDIPGGSGLFMVGQALGGTLDDAYVLRARGVRRWDRSAESLAGVLKADRIPITVADRRLKVASFELIEIVDSGSIDLDDLLVAFPTEAHAEAFVIEDNRWTLRPGDLVQVSIGREARPEGLWVPIQAIQEMNGDTAVFVVDEASRADRIPVLVTDSAGELRRIEGPPALDGARVVVDGAHFLMDGDLVDVRMSFREGEL